jgi:light-regulated signal transduction histidine kinase (bacteriophytochrome)
VIDRVLQRVLVQRAAELAMLNEELARSNSELDAFAYTTAHDLKEPLHGISNYAAILQEDYRQILDEEGRSRLSTLIRLSAHMDALISALLHYSQVGRTELSFADVDLNEVVQRALEVLSVTLEEKGVQVRIPRPLPTVWCDRVRIGEVFSNLISNAVKYDDKPEKWIEIGYQEAVVQEGTTGKVRQPVIFYVHDNGIGIREKYFDVIFHMFKRLHGRDVFGGGTGTGLAIVKRIVERHGGKIWVESTYGEGTTFYFTLQEGL